MYRKTGIKARGEKLGEEESFESVFKDEAQVAALEKVIDMHLVGALLQNKQDRRKAISTAKIGLQIIDCREMLGVDVMDVRLNILDESNYNLLNQKAIKGGYDREAPVISFVNGGRKAVEVGLTVGKLTDSVLTRLSEGVFVRDFVEEEDIPLSTQHESKWQVVRSLIGLGVVVVNYEQLRKSLDAEIIDLVSVEVKETQAGCYVRRFIGKWQWAE